MRGPAILVPVLLASLAAGAAAPSARAAQPAPANVEQARQAFERAHRAYNLGQWHEAADGFGEAYRMTGDPTLLFNRAQALRQGGRLGEAVTAYRAYLREKPDAANRAEVEQRILALEQQLQSERLRGSPGRAEDEAVTPTLDLTTPAPAAEPRRSRRWTWVAVGVTGLLAGGATIAGLTMRSRYHSLQDSCGRTPAGCSDENKDGLRTRVRVANVLWGLTAASAVATGVTFYLESGGARMQLAWRL
jgi:tetratricopeptide (TPR) repeat protein